MRLKSLRLSLLNLSGNFILNNNKKRRLYWSAISKAIDLKLPFVAYSLPGSSKINFFAQKSDVIDVPGVYDKRFIITPWIGHKSLTITADLDSNDVIKLTETETNEDDTNVTSSITPSTSYSRYCRILNEIIERLKQSGGKCVISRVESYNFMEGITSGRISEIAIKILSDFVDEFAYIFYHPRLGLWIAASPELLLKANMITGKFDTMALAGTRPATREPKAWDEKNINEHHYVSEYIKECLNGFNLTYNFTPQSTLSTGRIEHIVTRFSGKMRNVEPTELVRTLHPTPAIAGIPVNDALSMIAEYEEHPRDCYCGTVTLETVKESLTYVNLRCVHITPQSAIFYGGGGITGASVPDEEWRESARKIASLMPYIFPTE